MKQLFEPGDFDELGAPHELSGSLSPNRKTLANFCNAKLASLGIDAETPEHLKYLRKQNEALMRQLADLERQLATKDALVTSLHAKLEHIRKQLADAPVVYGTYPTDLRGWGEREDCDTHSARLVDIKELPKGDIPKG